MAYLIGNNPDFQRIARVQVHIPLGKRNGDAGLFKFTVYLSV